MNRKGIKMSDTDLNTNRPQPRIHIGMTFNDVCAVLGPPTATNPGSEILGGSGKVVGVTTAPEAISDMRSKLYFTTYCLWRRPEGIYSLVIEYDKVARGSRTPQGEVENEPASKSQGLPARFVLIVTNGGEEAPQDVLTTMLREGFLQITPDALTNWLVDAEVAVDLPLDHVIQRATALALVALKNAGKTSDFLDMESMLAKRFRKARGPGSAGVIVTVAGPSGNPDSLRTVEMSKTGQRDVCGQCGITEKERIRQWNAPTPRGVVKIGEGDRGAFMYCPTCKEGICGRCSIDLGMTAGCPKCRTELIYMDGGVQ